MELTHRLKIATEFQYTNYVFAELQGKTLFSYVYKLSGFFFNSSIFGPCFLFPNAAT